MLLLAASWLLVSKSLAWTTTTTTTTMKTKARGAPFPVLGASSIATETDGWFSTVDDNGANTNTNTDASGEGSLSTIGIDQLKIQLLQLGAALDRGQAYNPTSGSYYEENMNVARSKIGQLLDVAAKQASPTPTTTTTTTAEGGTEEGEEAATATVPLAVPGTVPKSLEDIAGEWELVLSTVPHGIFRSSPFFLAIQESYEYAETKTFEDGTSKPGLFFKLHELQTCSWGASKVGRIAQHIDASSKYLYSTFDTSLFSMTVIPILGWFKLLPTFGGCVVTAATCSELTPDTFEDRSVARLDMVVDYTTSRKVDGLDGLPLLGDIIWKIKVPVGAIWKLFPWNKGREATCKVYINYSDRDFRIVQDIDGEYFVYTRPVVPRPLQIL